MLREQKRFSESGRGENKNDMLHILQPETPLLYSRIRRNPRRQEIHGEIEKSEEEEAMEKGKREWS